MIPHLAAAATAPSAVLTAPRWTVAPIEQGAGQADSPQFCTAKAGFVATLSFIFARDSSGGQSLALEFPARSFAAGATVPLILAMSDGQHSLQALAATDRILLLTLAKNGAVEKSLRQGKVAQLQIGQQTALFISMAGFSNAVDAIDRCLAGLAKGEEFSPLKVEVKRDSEQLETIAPIVQRDTTRISNVNRSELARLKPAAAAHTAVLEDEIRRLRQENQLLLTEKQQAERQLLAVSDGGDASLQLPVIAAPLPQIRRSDKQLSWPADKNFADIVTAYLLGEAAQCPADFAQTLGDQMTVISSGQPAQVAEIACVEEGAGAVQSAAAAVLFVGGKGVVDVIAHRGPAGLIEQALQARAAVMKALNIEDLAQR